ncbi:MAG: ribosome biogenesis GTPase YlqF [Pseudomonadota bacterium]|nr:ribosome biogenesis GTPase YlqF [Pseudomonadota bacterium]
MSIHWFPGHMATARREIRKAMPGVDFVIEVLDARIPFSSENPLVAELRGEKPCIQILNKSDLADPAVTAEWLECIAATPGVRAIPHHTQQGNLLRTVLALAGTLVAPSIRARTLAAMIVGIPNVGKSTLINSLAGRTIAKTGNKPAVTQIQQRVQVGTELVLFDTPGFLWPKLTPAACGYRLAVTGAISDRVTDYEDIATFAARFLRDRYPSKVAGFYGLAALPEEEGALLEAIARRRGFLGKGGTVDVQRAAERLILDLREGRFGPVSLERPSDCGFGAHREA